LLRKLLCSLFFLTSCGYRWHYDYLERPTVAVPFIQEDEDSALTNEIISCLESSGLVQVTPNGTYQLNVKPLYIRHEQIGYRRDPQKISGQVKKNLLASEGRTILGVEVTLIKGCDVAFGPYVLKADSEYDFIDQDSLKDLTFIDKGGELTEVIPFSLGQLESIESAQEASTRPLYRRLAKKIVDVLSSEW
jgi:hypothetical protein